MAASVDYWLTQINKRILSIKKKKGKWPIEKQEQKLKVQLNISNGKHDKPLMKQKNLFD